MKTMRAVTLKAYGAVNMLGIGQVPEPAFSRPNDVLIKVVAAGVNRADISQRRGHYPPPPGVSELLGLEVSGVVLRVGSNVKRFGEGDRVMALLAGGGYADLVVAHEGSVMKIPDEYSFVEAAAIPEGFLTAWQLLRRHGSLKKGQCVLVHAGASGVGTSLMQLAGKYFGAKVVATCSEGKVDFCKKFADIVVDRSPDEMGRCFCHKVKSAVGEDAVNLVVDPVVGGSYLNEDGIVLAQDGKIVVIALMGGSKVELNISTLLRKRGTIVFSKLRDQTDEYKASLVEEFEREVIPYLKGRIITPIVQRTFAMEDVAEAHIFMEGNMTNGKVILTMCDSTGELKSHLSRLRAAGRAGESQIRQRRALLRGTRQRRHQQVKDAGLSSRRSTSSTGADCSSKLRDMLPRNDLLESAIALTISENRDARTELEFMRHFMVGSLLSLASPVGIWDPYDVQPQVFALDKYIALPVFTSVDYLRLFCRRFRFTVRDPSGVLWADGPAEAAEEEQNGGAACTLPLPDVMASEWWARHVRRQSSNTLSGATEMCATRRGPLLAAAGVPVAEEITAVNEHNHRTCCMGADELFNYLESQPVETDGKAQNMGKRRKKGKKVCRVGMRGRKGTLERRDVPGGEEARGNRCRENEETIAAFWAKVRSTAPFQIKQATPLPTFGPLLHSFFVGYFADTETLLHNASIVPEKVDIVLNPASPIEFVLAREATDRVLQKDQLLLLAYRRVERELCGEFHRFFCLFAPEVLWARSACVPSPVPGTDKEVGYEVVILVQSEDPEFTLSSLRAAKARCLLMGHADLHILPWAAAAPHVQEASVVFYERAACSKGAGSSNRGELGVFEQRGPVQTINVARPADNFFHDPSAAYTESHAVFTEELKIAEARQMADNEEVPPSGPRMTREETDELVRRLYDQQMERAARREEERQRQLARPFCSSRRIKKDEEENLVRRIYDVQRERFQQSKEERERRLTLELQSKDKKLPESEIQDQVDRIYNQEVAKSKARREELQKRYLPEVPPKTIGKKQLKESVERLFRVDYVKRDEELFKKHVYPYDPPTTKISRTDVEAMANRLSRRGS